MTGSAGVPPAYGNAGVPPAEDAGRMPAFPGRWHSRGYLPHFDKPGLIQSITFRLFDSVPADVIEKWKRDLEWTEYMAADDPKAFELRKRIEDYSDQGYGECWLRRDDCASVVQRALLHFDADRYHLIEWCVMSNHVHVLIETLPGHPLETILHSWKSFSSKECNRILKRTGRFWMKEYFDRYVRNQKHFDTVVDYIRQNPVKAGLCKRPEDWKWSSAGTQVLPGTQASCLQRAGRMPAFPNADPTNRRQTC